MVISKPADPAAQPVLLLTGAAGGIGLAILQRARQDGYRVFAIDRADRPPRLATDSGTHWRIADVTRDDQTDASFAELDALWGRLDVAVLAAGAVGSGRVEEVRPDDFRRLLDLNLTSAFTHARLALPRLRTIRGSLVFLSSTNGISGGSPLSGPAYASAKAGLIALTKNIARDYGADGVRANCIAPGPIDTPMLDRLSEGAKASLRASIPLGDVGSAGDVANLVSFLISDQARYLTGLTVSVSGGMVMP